MDAKFTSAELNVCYKDFEGNSVPPSTSPCMRMKDMKEAENESPLTTNGDSCSSEEELFHLEMSNDEGSGGKRPKYHHPEDESEAASSSSSSKSAKDNELHGFGNPVIQAAMPSQKRGAGQPLCTSATEMTSKKARKMISISSKAAATNSSSKKDLQTLQSIRYEFGDDDPHMAKAAVYYLLLLEDQLVTKNFYEVKNRIHPKSISISVSHRRKLLDWLLRVNQQFSFNFDTWVLTASILDRFLSAQPIETDIFQLAGCAAFLIAAKHEERDPPKVSELVSLCAKCYMKSDFLKMERIMLRVLEWNIQTPMIHNLVREVALIQNLKPVDEDFLTQIIGKIIFHKSLAYMPPSKLAFTLISASDKFEVQDVEKAFKYLLYLLKQDPDETDDDINY
jgi:hypothetical protein